MEDVDQFIAIIMSSRSYCFTRFFDNVGMAEDWITNTFSEHDAVNYAVAQIEEAPTTLHLHAQGFMQLKQGRTMNWCKSNIPYIGQTSHLERRMGTADEARKYCMKEDTRVFPPKEIGRWTTQGQRSDLTTYAHRIKELALQGMKLPAVNRILADEMPGVHLRFRKNAQELFEDFKTHEIDDFEPYPWQKDLMDIFEVSQPMQPPPCSPSSDFLHREKQTSAPSIGCMMRMAARASPHWPDI